MLGCQSLLGCSLCRESTRYVSRSCNRHSLTFLSVDPSLFPLFRKYYIYSNSGFVVPCTTAPFGSVVQDYINLTATDTQVTIYRNDADREFVVAIAGTNTTRDYITNFLMLPVPYIGKGAKSCKGCFVHLGFQAAWISADAKVTSLVKDGLKAYPSYNVTIAGVSLGGALAHLAFLSFNASGIPVTAAYTFGQPRVGNRAFADFTDRLSGATDQNPGIYYRVTHTNDGVPQLPFKFLGYQHSRIEYWELDAADGEPSRETTYRCIGQEAADCNASEGEGFINDAHLSYAGHLEPANLCQV